MMLCSFFPNTSDVGDLREQMHFDVLTAASPEQIPLAVPAAKGNIQQCGTAHTPRSCTVKPLILDDFSVVDRFQ